MLPLLRIWGSGSETFGAYCTCTSAGQNVESVALRDERRNTNADVPEVEPAGTPTVRVAVAPLFNVAALSVSVGVNPNEWKSAESVQSATGPSDQPWTLNVTEEPAAATWFTSGDADAP